MLKNVLRIFAVLFLLPAAAAFAAKPFTFGIIMVGPYNDHGWSESHYEAGKYVEANVPGAKMIYIDKVNPADRPGITIPQIADDMVEKGASLIIANSNEMGDGIREAAMMHPDVKFVHVSGDDVLTGKAPENLSNVMGRMEYGAMMAGFAAAMTTQTGKIGVLGPLINEETRRHVSSYYLGAKYAWETVLKRDIKDLTFKVTWIGFWFHIPGVTADPTQVTQNFFDAGYDVVINRIDTTEALTVADQNRRKGKTVWAVTYDYKNGCDGAPEACLGVPYFNWGPVYTQLARSIQDKSWKQQWIWDGPNWADINDMDQSAIGFIPGPALSAAGQKGMEQFISDLGSGKLNLFKGPLNYQDGTVFLKKGESATDKQIWYLEQLLEGITGQSSAK